MVRLQAHLLGKNTLTGAALQAADLNGDGQVTITDMIRLQAYLLGRAPSNPTEQEGLTHEKENFIRPGGPAGGAAAVGPGSGNGGGRPGPASPAPAASGPVTASPSPSPSAGSNIQGITAVLHYDSSALTLTGTRQLVGSSWSRGYERRQPAGL